MAIKVDIARQSLIIYCGITLSGCLGLLSLFILILHLPLMPRNYQFAIYLELDMYNMIWSSMMCICFCGLIASSASFLLFIFFTNKKALKTFSNVLRPVYLFHCIFTFVNIGCVLFMIDSIGILQTEVQYRFYQKIKMYASNLSNLEKGDYNENKGIIDRIQQTTKCCGVMGPTDWFNIKWISIDELNDLKGFKYLTRQGLVSLAPLSCCDRMKTFICPLKDTDALKRYYSKGCRFQLSESIKNQLMTTEIVLSLITIFFQILLIIVFTLIISSVKSMSLGVHGENIGIASFTSWIPTRHLELQSRGTPLLMPPTEEDRPFQMKKLKFIEKTKSIGKVIEGTPYLRNLRENYPSTKLQVFLKTYLPIVDRAIFDEDPTFNVVMFRFIMKAVIGSQIAHLFLSAFSTAIEGQTRVSETLVDLGRYSTYIAFTYAFIKSTKFRAVAILLLPNLGLKTGRAFLMAELARTTAVGPLACIAGNIQAVMLALHCSIGIALKISKDIQRISINPMRKLITKTVELSDQLKRDTLDVYNASRPITNEIDESENRSKQIRQALTSGQSTREVNLKNRFTKLLHRLDGAEQRKYQQKTQKLRDQYAKLQDQLRKSMIMIDKYQDVFSNKSSKIVSDIRTKTFSGCASIEQVKSQICQKVIAVACGKIQQLITGNLNLGFSIKDLCYDEIDSDSSCNVKKALEKAQKCANEQEASIVKDGFGGIHQGTKGGLDAMKEIFDFNVSWKFERKPFDINSEVILHGAASLTFILSDSVIVLADVIILLFVILKILLMLVVFRAYKYCKKYLADIDYDNKYVTAYFEQIDQQRKLVNRTNLLPLKSYERKRVLYKQALYTKDEINKVVRDLIKITAVVLSLAISFMIARVFYSALEVVKDVSLIELSIRSDELLNITTTGDGFVKNLIDVLLEEVKTLGNFNVTYTLSDCAPNINPVSDYYKRVFIITSVIIYTLTISNGYLIRSRHVICAYFYPKRERQRIVHLYNSLLVGRKRYMKTKKNIIIFKVRQNRLQAEYSFLISLRRDYPLFCSWLKVFSKHRCLICDDVEKENFFICQFDLSSFCQDCFDDIDNECLVCLMSKMEAEQENVNNYYESQMFSDSDQTDYSTSGKENSDIENSKELVGWLEHPIDVLKDDISIYRSIMKELNK